MLRMLALTIVLALLPFPQSAGAAPPGCSIEEGAAIGGVLLGMRIAEALAVAGPPLRQHTVGAEVIYTLRAPWVQLIAERGAVRRISARGADCRTGAGIGPGSTLAQVRSAYAGARVSTMTPVQDGALLTFPFIGIAFLVRADHVDTIEVFEAERFGVTGAAPPTPTVPRPAPVGPTPPGATPTPTPTTAPGAWRVVSTATRVEDGAVVVSGVLENRDRPIAVYADVRVRNAAGHQVAQGDAPTVPNPVPVGRRATFEVRLPVDQVVRRFTVTIRPANAPSVSLAEVTGEIKDLQQFAAMAIRQVTATVQSTSVTPSKDTFIVTVTNGSGLKVESATVAVQMVVTCRVAGAPIPVLVAQRAAAAPPPTPRTIQETWTGAVTLQQIGPRATGQAPLPLSGGVCLLFLTWSATSRISDVKIVE